MTLNLSLEEQATVDSILGRLFPELDPHHFDEDADCAYAILEIVLNAGLNKCSDSAIEMAMDTLQEEMSND